MSNIVGLRLNKIRNNLNMTQEQFARFLDVNYRTYQNWEEGSRLPNVTALIQIADKLHVSIDWLLGRDEKFTVYNFNFIMDVIKKMTEL